MKPKSLVVALSILFFIGCMSQPRGFENAEKPVFSETEAPQTQPPETLPPETEPEEHYFGDRVCDEGENYETCLEDCPSPRPFLPTPGTEFESIHFAIVEEKVTILILLSPVFPRTLIITPYWSSNVLDQ